MRNEMKDAARKASKQMDSAIKNLDAAADAADNYADAKNLRDIRDRLAVERENLRSMARPASMV